MSQGLVNMGHFVAFTVCDNHRILHTTGLHTSLHGPKEVIVPADVHIAVERPIGGHSLVARQPMILTTGTSRGVEHVHMQVLQV